MVASPRAPRRGGAFGMSVVDVGPVEYRRCQQCGGIVPEWKKEGTKYCTSDCADRAKRNRSRQTRENI